MKNKLILRLKSSALAVLMAAAAVVSTPAVVYANEASGTEEYYAEEANSDAYDNPVAVESNVRDIEVEPLISYEASATTYFDAGADTFFYDQLNEKLKRVYRSFLQCGNYHTSIHAVTFAEKDENAENLCTLAEVTLAYQSVIYDHPELFWYNLDSRYSFGYISVNHDSSKVYAVNLIYSYDTEEAYEEGQSKLSEAVTAALEGIDTDTMPPAEIALRLHDKIIGSVSYFYDGTKLPHTAYGALVVGQAVCDGYTLAYNYLLRQCGITAVPVVGSSKVGSREKHMWSMVNLGGEWYEVDCTWDTTTSNNEVTRHRYFNLTTEEMSVNHERENSSLAAMIPETSATHFNYNYMTQCGRQLGTQDTYGNELVLLLQKDGNVYGLGALPEETEYAVTIGTTNGTETAVKNDGTIWAAAADVGESDAVNLAANWNSQTNSAALKKTGSGTDAQISFAITFDNGAKADLTGNIGLAGELVNTDGGQAYRYADGTLAKNTQIYSGGSWYNADENGNISNGWITGSDGSIYYRDANGNSATGWKKIDGKWYYFGDTGAMQTGWKKVGRYWYYFNNSGAMLSGWQKLTWNEKTNWYYFGSAEDGAMKIGWRYINGKWYFFHGGGTMASGWQSLGWSGGKNWFYFGSAEDGSMKTRWQNLGWSGGKNWFYFDASSGAMLTGWQELGWSAGTNWFYFNTSDGAMVTGTRTIDGKSYTFNSSGALQ